MKKAMVVAGLVLALGAAGCSRPAAPAPKAEEKSAGGVVLKPQEICPVMGGKVNRAMCTVYEGKCVYFCCESCVPKFKKDPEKYIRKLQAQGVTLDAAAACEVH